MCWLTRSKSTRLKSRQIFACVETRGEPRGYFCHQKSPDICLCWQLEQGSGGGGGIENQLECKDVFNLGRVVESCKSPELFSLKFCVFIFNII